MLQGRDKSGHSLYRDKEAVAFIRQLPHGEES